MKIVIKPDDIRTHIIYKKILPIEINPESDTFIIKFNEKDPNLCGLMFSSDELNQFSVIKFLDEDGNTSINSINIYEDDELLEDFAWLNLDEPYIILLNQNYELIAIDMTGKKIALCMTNKSSFKIPLGKQINIKKKNIEYQNMFNIDDEVKN